jgi:hypothetical protein
MLLKSKTFWTGITTAMAGFTLIMKGDTINGFQLMATGLCAIFLRDAINNKNIL